MSETVYDLAETLRKALPHQATVLDLARETLTDGTPQIRLMIGSRTLLPERQDRRESGPRAHVFHDLQAFCDYLAKYGGDHTVVLGDQGETGGVVSAVLEETASHGRETVHFEPRESPQLEDWRRILAEGKYPVAALGMLLVERRRQINDPNSIIPLRQVRVSQDVQAAQGLGIDATNGVMVETKIRGEVHREEVLLPDSVAITCPLYQGQESETWEMDLTVYANGTEAMVRVSALDLNQKLQDAWTRMMTDIQDALGETLPKAIVGTGCLKHLPWWEVSPGLPADMLGTIPAPGRIVPEAEGAVENGQ